MYLVGFALRILRLAGEAFFCFEVNRFLGLAVRGPIAHRRRALQTTEHSLLKRVRAPVVTRDVRLPNGLVLHTIIAGFVDQHSSTAAGKQLVLLHGHSMAGAFFSYNIDDFLDMGYTTIYIPDLPGWGRSSRPVFTGPDVESAVDFFLNPLHMWLQELNLQSFTLCGHSLGAYLAHEYSIRHPQYVSRLILASPAAITRNTPFGLAAWFAFTPQRFMTHGGLLAHILFARKYPRKEEYNRPGLRDFTLYANSVAHRSGDAAAAKMLRFWRQAPTRWHAECVRPLLERVRKLSCCVEIISGDRDVLVHVEAVRTLYRAMTAVGNNVKLDVIQNADHSPHICMPERFAKAIMRGMDMASSAVQQSGVKKIMNGGIALA